MQANKNIKFDLEERTARFGENVIIFCRTIPKDIVTASLITQLIKCATSIGANYCEADDAESKLDFKHKIGISKKEAREAKHFLRMLATALPGKSDEIKLLWSEARELNLILNAIYIKVS